MDDFELSELDAQKRPETEELWVHTSEGQSICGQRC